MLVKNAISLYIPSSSLSSLKHSFASSDFMDFTEKMQRQKMGFHEYIEALEEEWKKIQVFSRELPCSLELVRQAIEACRKQLPEITTEHNWNVQSESNSDQTSMDAPVLEEFIPIKKRASPDCEEEDEDEQHSYKAKISKDNNSTDKKKSDWLSLRSVQLGNPDPPTEEEPRKASLVEFKRKRGAFQPFHRDQSVGATNVSAVKSPSSEPLTAVTSPVEAVTTTGDNAGSGKREEKEGQRKQRRCWSQELHKRFLQALQQLGGAENATPKQIRELMKVDGLTNDEVKSHLQKFRLHIRRPSTISNSNVNPHTAPFVLVGNVFVQPQEYATVSTSTAPTTVTAHNGVYAPVAAHPLAIPLPHTLVASIKKPQFKKLGMSEHSHSEERANQSEGPAHSSSPASSSSTHTTTASPGY